MASYNIPSSMPQHGRGPCKKCAKTSEPTRVVSGGLAPPAAVFGFAYLCVRQSCLGGAGSLGRVVEDGGPAQRGVPRLKDFLSRTEWGLSD